MNPIEEHLEVSESNESETRSHKSEESEDDDLGGRSHENIDLDSVEVTSKGSPGHKQQKPILS